MRRSCALVVVLALLAGMAIPGAGTPPGCSACPPGCPMHAKRLGCHQARKIGCHEHAPACGIRNACHGQDPATDEPSAVRGVMPAGVEMGAAPRAGRAKPSSTALASRPLPEPPTAPPRSVLA